MPKNRYTESPFNRSKPSFSRKPPSGCGGGLSSVFGQLAFDRLDIGDILLWLILLLLYNETGDEEFLIILLVTAFTSAT